MHNTLVHGKLHHSIPNIIFAVRILLCSSSHQQWKWKNSKTFSNRENVWFFSFYTWIHDQQSWWREWNLIERERVSTRELEKSKTTRKARWCSSPQASAFPPSRGYVGAETPSCAAHSRSRSPTLSSVLHGFVLFCLVLFWSALHCFDLFITVFLFLSLFVFICLVIIH